MQYLHFQNNTDLSSWANSLAIIMEQRGKSSLAVEIQSAIEQFQSDSFTIAVIGKAKRGKSTLINALMGRQDDILAPIDKLPTSSAITRFRWGKTEKAEVFFQDNRKETIPWDSIRNYVTEEFNRGNSKGVSTVVVEGPIEGLKEHVELVDTPGAGSIHEYHDALLHAFIPQADAVIFIVTARMPFDQDELELLSQVKKADISKVFFVINRVDEIDEEEDLRNAVQHNQELLVQNGIQCDNMFKISAKYAFQGKQGSGIEVLIKEIEAFISKERIQVQRKRFVSRVCKILEPEIQSLATTLASLGKSNEQIDEEICTLQSEYNKMDQHRYEVEEKFNLNWNDAVNNLYRRMISAESEVKNIVLAEIDKYSVLGVSQLAKKLPTILVNKLEAYLHPITEQFETSAQTLCRELQVSYPVLEINEFSKLTLKPQGQIGTIVTTIGGVGAVAGGTALVSAGASAAAGIAAANAAAMGAATAAATTGSEMLLLPLLASGGYFCFTGDLLGAATILGVAGSATASTAAATGGATAISYTATPLWVALAGPIGWTIAGLGIAAVPLAWSISKSKQKNKIREAAEKKIEEIFKIIKEERIPNIRDMGKNIVNSFRDNLSNKKHQIENALLLVRQNRPSDEEISKLQKQSDELQNLMSIVSEGNLS